MWLKRKMQLRQVNLAQKDPGKAAAAKVAFDKWLAEEFQPQLAKLKVLAKDYEEQIYAANQPAVRQYELVRLK
jgi:hypothetical protein